MRKQILNGWICILDCWNELRELDPGLRRDDERLDSDAYPPVMPDSIRHPVRMFLDPGLRRDDEL